MRLEQRVGRVDRIGGDAGSIDLYTMLPAGDTFEEYLTLVKRLTAKETQAEGAVAHDSSIIKRSIGVDTSVDPKFARQLANHRTEIGFGEAADDPLAQLGDSALELAYSELVRDRLNELLPAGSGTVCVGSEPFLSVVMLNRLSRALRFVTFQGGGVQEGEPAAIRSFALCRKGPRHPNPMAVAGLVDAARRQLADYYSIPENMTARSDAAGQLLGRVRAGELGLARHVLHLLGERDLDDATIATLAGMAVPTPQDINWDDRTGSWQILLFAAGCQADTDA